MDPKSVPGQVVISRDEERAALFPELVEALCSMVEFFGPYAHGSADNRRDALVNANALLAKAEALS